MTERKKGVLGLGILPVKRRRPLVDGILSPRERFLKEKNPKRVSGCGSCDEEELDEKLDKLEQMVKSYEGEIRKK